MAEDEMKYKVVVVGGSAGSLDVILKMVPDLPAQAGVLFIIVVHRKNDADSILTELISSRTEMKVREVEDKEAIFPNTIYIAPSDYHLLVENEKTFCLDSSEKVHHSRPSIDVTFESVAEIFRSSAIGVLLSGANADGANGLKIMKGMGGFTIVQDPNTADVGFMPQQAINRNAVDEIVSAEALAETIKKLIVSPNS